MRPSGSKERTRTMGFTKKELLAILTAQFEIFAAPTLGDELKAAISSGGMQAIEIFMKEKTLAAAEKAGIQNVTPAVVADLREAMSEFGEDNDIKEMAAKMQTYLNGILSAAGLHDLADD